MISGNNVELRLKFWGLPQKGDLKYEYQPLKVMRSTQTVSNNPPGTLLDLNTSLLNFDLTRPVSMLAQPSYDGSVNLILNDGKNKPRLINTRFSVTGKDTYQIVDRDGDNDTNIYDVESFDTDTSLYKRINRIIDIKFNGVSPGGRLKVGNYVFYFRLSDDDGNETDFAGESGIVSCYIGGINDPASIQGGNRDENSSKMVNFTISNIDTSYNYVIVYYTRSTSDIWTDETTTAFKILKKYPVNNNRSQIVVNGFEDKIEVSLNDINTQYQIVDSAYTQASAQNRLFLGNLNKQDIDYKAFTQLSLQFYPVVDLSANIGYVNENYKDISAATYKYEYYNPHNIYRYLGYWNKEIYRFGVVYVLDDFSLTPVFNVCGRNILDTNIPSDLTTVLSQEISIDKDTYNINESYNSKGVSYININSGQIGSNAIHPIGIQFKSIHENTILKEKLQELNIRGYFFVRQKRIPTILCQVIPIGLELNSHLPTLQVDSTTIDPLDEATSGTKRYMMESFIDKNRILEQSLEKRKRIYDDGYIQEGGAAICPEFELNQPFFNQFFTASDFQLDEVEVKQGNQAFCLSSGPHYWWLPSADKSTSQTFNAQIVAVEDNVKLMKNKTLLYSARAGEAEEGGRTAQAKFKNDGASNLHVFRGSYGPYLGIECNESIPIGLYNVRIPGYDSSLQNNYFKIRFQDTSAFYAISERIRTEEAGTVTCYRGDCFIGNYTHRMLRNFQDPTNPINDEILNRDTWKEYYDVNNLEKLAKLNRGDVNAVKLGHWFTTKVFSNLNVSLRSVDHSYASEELTNNRPRNFYPLFSMDRGGQAKIPESFAYNHGYSSTTSDKYNWETPSVPALKNVFKTRVLFSEVSINDAFKNGFREFLSTNYRDYPLTYGELTKLVELQGDLIAIFEHGIGRIPVNERVVAGRGTGGNVFINTANVLPETMKIITDMYGSQWAESVIKTPYYIYGVDTVGKKIWRTNGNQFDIISDFRVEKFLIDNITLAETEKTPIIGVRNVKTHYNAYKGDVLFTFYDILDPINERAWNLCWNELSQVFTTFYSWLPSYSENIDNMFFTFNRETSKVISLQSGGIYPIAIRPYTGGDPPKNCLGQLYAPDYPDATITWELLHYYDSAKFTISDGLLIATNLVTSENDLITCAIKGSIVKTTTTGTGTSETVVSRILYGVIAVNNHNVSHAFWKHGQAGLTETDRIRPCFWYGEQHPFEFEFVVRDDPNTHKIFNNLEIISNKAKPESFHFQIVGEVYDWAKDKKNMFVRQEATKELYQNLGASLRFDNNYKSLTPSHRGMIGSIYFDKSTYLPLYYERRNKLNSMYDTYTMMHYNSPEPKDYCNLSGSEITYDPDLNEFGVWTHIKNIPIDSYIDTKITQEQYNYIRAHFLPTQRRVFAWVNDNNVTEYYERTFPGRLRGNSQYLEDKWNVQIPSITFMQKNEGAWPNGYPPLIVESNRIPDVQRTSITESTMPTHFTLDNVQVMPNTYDRGNGYGELTINGWTSRKETKIRDKYLKVRIRYSGEDLAVISAIKTLYTISYA